jgi:hypothetical protein
MNKRFNNLVVTLILAGITSLLILLAQTQLVKLEVLQVLMVIAGMTLLATFNSLQGFINSLENNELSIQPEDVIEASLLSESVSSVLDKFPNKHIKELPSWEIKPNDLVGRDNSLALAKLRIDIERELRQIAEVSGLDIDKSLVGIPRLMDELLSKKALPIEWSYALRDIVDVCNRAIHGMTVSDDLTFKVIKTGNELLNGLYSIRQEKYLDPTWELSNVK